MSSDGRWVRVQRLSVVDVWLPKDYAEEFTHDRSLLNARCNNQGSHTFTISELETGKDVTPENLNRSTGR